MSTTTKEHELEQPLFTCLSCSIGFVTAEDQRVHYRSDHHRYNMKRRVAGLPPVSAIIFNEKVSQRRADTAVTTSPKGSTCEVCNKVYTTENAYRSHLNSKKHKETEAKTTADKQKSVSPSSSQPVSASHQSDTQNPIRTSPPAAADESRTARSKPPVLTDNADADEDDINQSIDAKIAAARSRLSINSCLFCSNQSSSLQDSLSHMAAAHSFFIPDMEYLQDLPGLITYLGEKIAVGNVCLYCNGKGREFRTIEAVWKHMIDKGHCKIAYDQEKDQLEISDYYDFSESYPDAVRNGKRPAKAKRPPLETEEDEWEDVDDDREADEIVETETSPDEDEDDLPVNQATYGDTPYELVLPSGARIGHRSLKRYYDQSYSTNFLAQKSIDPKSGTAIARRLLADKRSDLVPVKGGFGAFGAGTQVVKARNRGEAREAGRHIREFRDQKRKEDYKTRVAFVHNHQKHYRDPLLQ